MIEAIALVLLVGGIGAGVIATTNVLQRAWQAVAEPIRSWVMDDPKPRAPRAPRTPRHAHPAPAPAPAQAQPAQPVQARPPRPARPVRQPRAGRPPAQPTVAPPPAQPATTGRPPAPPSPPPAQPVAQPPPAQPPPTPPRRPPNAQPQGPAPDTVPIPTNPPAPQPPEPDIVQPIRIPTPRQLGVPNVAGDIGNVHIPAEINDHSTLIRVARQLLNIINNGMGGVRKLLKTLVNLLTQLSLALQKIMNLPEKVGPHIGRDTPTFQAITTQAEIARQTNTRILEAIAQLQQIENAMTPLEDATGEVEKQATEAVGA